MIDDIFLDFSTYSTERIVEVALEDMVQLKAAAPELDGRPPSYEAARIVLDAFAEERAEAWVAARLLGCIGHECGYETVHAFLLREGMAASYAGPAMVSIRGGGAFDDLREALFTAATLMGREGAAAGLASLGPRATGPILSATLQGRIRWQSGAQKLKELRVDSGVVAELLASRQERAARVGSEAMWFLVGDMSTDARAWLRQGERVLVEPLRELLDSPTFTMHPRKRKVLETWLLDIWYRQD